MKSNLIILAVLGAAAIWFFGAKSTPPAQTQPLPASVSVPPGPAGPPPTPAPSAHMDGVSVDRLVIVRGTVRGATADGLLIECFSRLPNADARHVQEDRERDRWGEILILEKGVLQPTPYIPSLTAGGQVLLRGHPEENRFVKGDRVRIVATELPEYYPTGYARVRAYTVDFTLEGGKTAAQAKWNQENLNSKGALDSRPHR